MTIEETRKADVQAEAIQRAMRAATRADSGEFVFSTRDEVSAFVNALPSDVKVRWQVEAAVGMGYRYRVTFWRSMWRSGGRKATAEPKEESQP